MIQCAHPIDCCCDEGRDPALRAKFKGSMNVEKLEQIHLDVAADAVTAVRGRAAEIRHGYKITWPPILRHFQASLAPVL